MQLLIAFACAAFVYLLVLFLFRLLTFERDAVQERLRGIKELPAAESRPAMPRKRVKKKSSGGETLARTKKKLEKLENQLYDVGIRIPVQKFLSLWFGITILLPALLILSGVPGFVPLAAALVCALGPILYINLRRKKRREELEGQLTEAISILCNALRAGHSFQIAMQNISNEMTGAVSDEFGRVFRETQHGITLEESFGRMVDRVGSGDLEMLCTAILIQREVGGNLAEVLENISGTVQARLALKSEIKTRTASGRLSGYLIGAIPIILLVAMKIMNPDYCDMLFTTDIGHIMLAISAGMEITGVLVIMKMVSVKY